MFTYLGTKEQLLRERRRNEQLRMQMEKTVADLEYLAMMTDVELEEYETDGDRPI